MEITSKSNSLIKELKKQKEHSRFLLFLDTPKMVKEALINGFRPLYMFVLKEKQFDFLSGIDVIFTTKEILSVFSNVKTNAGIVGVFEMKFANNLNLHGNYVVLDTVQDAGNVGAILRSALACDFRDVIAIDSASVTSEKVVRSSAGAVLKLNISEVTKSYFLQNFKQKNLYYADMCGDDIFQSIPKQPVGIVMGNEGNGVSKEVKALCQGSVSIPMKNDLESLNVAVSAGLIMYQISFGGKL